MIKYDYSRLEFIYKVLRESVIMYRRGNRVNWLTKTIAL